MTQAFDVRYTDGARDHLLRLFDFLLAGAKTVEDFDDAQSAINAIEVSVQGHLGPTPFIYCKAGQSPFLRELVVPFQAAGYVVLYEIGDGYTVNVLAVRDQREDDYF